MDSFDICPFCIAGANKELRDMDGNAAFSLTKDDEIQSLLASGDEHLFMALKHCDVDATCHFLDVIDVNTTFLDHLTPLHIACEKGSVALCELLISCGARINVLVSLNTGYSKQQNKLFNLQLLSCNASYHFTSSCEMS